VLVCCQIFSKEYINMLLTVYFFFLGIFALAHIIRQVCTNTFSYLTDFRPRRIVTM